MKKITPLQELNYKVYFNDSHQNKHLHPYSSNKVRTSKYTLLTFIPKSLYIQFMRIANAYFLVIAILTNIDEISTINPIGSIIPLSIVLGTSLIREAIEDWARHKNDRLINNQLSENYQLIVDPKDPEEKSHQFVPTKWKDLKIGDYIKVEKNQQIPADVVLLDSSDENGAAYVETANLDGEKNLKLKQINHEVRGLIAAIGLQNLKGAMLVDSPNPKLQAFRGVLELEGLQTIYLNYSNILLRGTYLKNVDHVIGIVVYTGHSSKLMQNQGGVRNKRSHIEKCLNQYIIGIFVVQCILCILLAVMATYWNEKYQNQNGPHLSYLFPASYQTQAQLERLSKYSPFVQGFINFASFMLLLNSMIPISLMVSLEFTKFFQGLGMKLDVLLEDNGQRCAVQNLLIHEDLAKIDYIFADKTGTLTTNEMKFMNCSIQGRIFSKFTLLDFGSPLLNQRLRQSQDNTSFQIFWLTISLCHDVVVDNHAITQGKLFPVRYHGSSPDEVELVNTAADIGFEFKEKKGDIYHISVYGEIKKFLFLTKIDFSSDRKRMSLIFRDLEKDKIFMFCKGADSMILPRIGSCSLEIMEKTQDDLQKFSKEGLRTLAIAYKEIKAEIFNDWFKRYNKAKQEEFLMTCEDAGKSTVSILEEEIEKDLVILGVTALEDKLQSGVAETIIDLHKAGIKVWMLTGDKLETAENIGYATNLLARDTRVFKIETFSPDETLKRLEKIQEKIKQVKENGFAPSSVGEVLHEMSMNVACFTSFGLIIDGEAINHMFKNEKLKNKFLEMIPEFRTVICCRSTPNQKADVVTFVKHNLKKMTLAIGDGGNDVNMIQRAHVGVGIFGKEGNHAAFASDYAIAKFSFLWRLLFVHGRWAYFRTSNFVNFFFYKNLIFTLPQFWFALYSGYSGQSIYDSIYIMNYNTIFTSVAPVYYASYEQDVNPRENQTIRKASPYLYADFRKTDLLSLGRFIFWWGSGIIHSVIIFQITMVALEGTVNSQGKTFDIWGQSATTFSGILFTVISIIFIGTNQYNALTFVCYIIFTLLAFFPAGIIILDQFDTPMQYILKDLLYTPKVWPVLLLGITVCSLTVALPKLYLFHFRPSLIDLLRKDKIKHWKIKISEQYEAESPNFSSQSPVRFDFDSSIVLGGWCDTKQLQEG